MKKSTFFLLSMLTSLCSEQTVFADGITTPPKDSLPNILKQIKPELIYSYLEFNFNSKTGLNFNSYRGHSNIYAAGGDNILIRPDIIAGVYYFNVDTNYNAEVLLAPSTASFSDQSIQNSTIFGHVLKVLSPNWFVDLAGGYGFDQLNIVLGVDNPLPYVAKTDYNNWFTSVNLLYRYNWDKLLLKTNLGAFYSQINTPAYQFVPTANGLSPVTVNSLVNKVTLAIENAELGYALNNELMPFINIGLIQVPQFSNSRPLTSTVINGSLPQLSLNKSAFRLGAGFNVRHKQLSVRVEEKYYNSEGSFISYQTMLSLEYQFA